MAPSGADSSAGLGIDAAYLVKRRHLLGFALSLVLSGQYLTAWPDSSVAVTIAAWITTASAHYCMSSCTCSLLAAIPFSGGAFGLARVALGFYVGFLVAFAECMEYVFCTADAVQQLGATMVLVAPSAAPYVPLLYIAIYAVLVRCHGHGGPVIWRSYALLACLLVTGIATLGGSSLSRLAERPAAPATSPGNPVLAFLSLLPAQMRLFIGLECLNLCGQDVDDPQIALPRIKRVILYVALASSLLLLLVLVVLWPSDGATTVAVGLAAGLAVPASTAELLVAPAMVANALTFMHGYSRVLLYMGSSRLVHRSLKGRIGRHRTPKPALYAGSIVGCAFCVLSHYAPAFALWPCAVACASCMYISQCYGYIYFTTSVQRHSSSVSKAQALRRRAAAVYAAVVFALGLVACVATNVPTAPANSNVVVAGVLGALVAALTVYYHVVVKTKQMFSEHERRSLMVAHIIVFNKQKLRQSTQRLRKVVLEQRAILYLKHASTSAAMTSAKTLHEVRRMTTDATTAVSPAAPVVTPVAPVAQNGVVAPDATVPSVEPSQSPAKEVNATMILTAESTTQKYRHTSFSIKMPEERRRSLLVRRSSVRTRLYRQQSGNARVVDLATLGLDDGGFDEDEADEPSLPNR
ncbi:Amino Acid-Polyamine-Organocation (APC) Family [Achlya hypogyna]|uniref:Amino Acid-Polyamine-Organocation (APC) Family n=1 Tax=Achlya hypogyna TaxID=1202772 RepID=A0A1V9Z3E3_ACHHY|nr:Amino Acid-Polyamine-Organocation (APC) Family [Achlya hypogyna]